MSITPECPARGADNRKDLKLMSNDDTLTLTTESRVHLASKKRFTLSFLTLPYIYLSLSRCLGTTGILIMMITIVLTNDPAMALLAIIIVTSAQLTNLQLQTKNPEALRQPNGLKIKTRIAGCPARSVAGE